MYCLEYRGPGHNVVLPHVLDEDGPPFKGGKEFYLPENLYVIGTMNHADRSISGVDMALRRRFAWYKMEPMTWFASYLADKNFDKDSLDSFCDAATKLNERIKKGIASDDESTRLPLDVNKQIGDSYFILIDEIAREAIETGNNQFEQTRRILPQHRETLWLYYLRPLLEDYLGDDVHSYDNALTELGKQFIGRK